MKLKQRKLKIALFLVLTIVCCHGLYGCLTNCGVFSINGRVTDRNGQGIPDVFIGTIEHTFVDHENLGDTKTDKDGYYKLENVQRIPLIAYYRIGVDDIDIGPLDFCRTEVRRTTIDITVTGNGINGRVTNADTKVGIRKIGVKLRELEVETTADGTFSVHRR